MFTEPSWGNVSCIKQNMKLITMDTPHQSAPVNRKRKGWPHVPVFHGLQSQLASREL